MEYRIIFWATPSPLSPHLLEILRAPTFPELGANHVGELRRRLGAGVSYSIEDETSRVVAVHYGGVSPSQSSG